MSRPFIQKGIDALEELADKQAGDPKVIAALLDELLHRNTPRAKKLLRRLKERPDSASAQPGSVASARVPRPQPAVPMVLPDASTPDSGAGDGIFAWDDRQRDVIDAATASRILVSAGPGMGKTAVACGRVAHLLEEGLEPSRMCLISFTRTAVQEIRERVRKLSHDHPGVNSLRVATIDSHAWQLLQGFDPDAARAFGGYEQNIEALTQRLRARDADLLEFLAGIEHLMVDEAQDVVGVRTDFLVELIRALPMSCGVTIFTDDAQAIYGFTDDSIADNEPPDNLPTRIRDGVLAGFRQADLLTIHRTSKKNLKDLFSHGRQHAVRAHSNPAEAQTRVRECVARYANGTIGGIESQGLEGKQDTLVLFRTRAEVLEASSYLGAVEHRIRMSGTPHCIHPWLGIVFWDYQEDRISEEAFGRRWEERVRGLFPLVDPERSWKALRFAAGDGKQVRMESLRMRLSRGSAPLELIVPELGFRGPILGTIHASKGREASIVHLMLPEAGDEGAAGEARVTFVGATRAKQALLIGNGKRLFARKTPNGRVYMKAAKKHRARVEIGRDEDVDVAAQARRGLWQGESGAGSQEFLRRCANRTLPVIMRANSADQFRFAIICQPNGGEPQLVGHATPELNADLFRIAHDLWPGSRLKPLPEIRNVRYLGARTLVPPAEQREVLVEPFNRTGFLLAPILSALTMVPFSGYP